jgi:hypothetical protein
MVKVGAYAMIEDEWVSIIARDPISKTVTVARGIFDTIPVSHPAGAYLWFHQGLFGLDSVERVAGEQVEVKFLPATGIGRLAIGSAPSDTLILTGRMMRPYPPGNVKLNSIAWPSSIPVATPLTISWSHRDRTLQTVTHNRQDEGDIGPEIGTTYKLRIYGNGGVLKRTPLLTNETSYQYKVIDELADNGVTFGSDSNWANVVLAVPMDGSDGSTSFTDVKGNIPTVIAATLSTLQSKFSGSSGKFSNGNVSYPSVASFNVDNSDFTVEFYTFLSTSGRSSSSDGVLFQIGGDNSNGYFRIVSLYPETPAKLEVVGYNAGVVVLVPSPAATLSDDTWYHVALSKQGDIYRLFLNGVLYSSATVVYTHTQGNVSIGRSTAGSYPFNGYIDNLRFTNGVSRYNAGFTPPGAMCNLITDLNSTLRVELESSRDSMLSLNKWDVATTRS